MNEDGSEEKTSNQISKQDLNGDGLVVFLVGIFWAADSYQWANSQEDPTME